MKKIFNTLLVIILIISLGLNALLIYNIKNGSNEPECDVIEKDTNKIYGKDELGDLFKDYQTTSGLAVSDNVALWNVDKITYKGFFISDGRKLFIIDETFSCLEGTACVNSSNASIDENYNVKASYVVAIDDNNSKDIKFYILDESIMNDNDFNSEKEYDLK